MQKVKVRKNIKPDRNVHFSTPNKLVYQATLPGAIIYVSPEYTIQDN